MNIRQLLKVLTINIVLVTPIFAHDGHDHGTPGVLKAPHGGIAKGGQSIDIELVQNEDSIVIHGLNADSTTINIGTFKVAGTIEFLKGKPTPLQFEAIKDGYKAPLSFISKDGKSLGHRAKLDIEVTPTGKAAEKFSFQIEPQN